jgi:y4mF family transcriptional regulator
MTPQEIGQTVRKARKAQGLRQRQLAGAAGVGLRFLSELESGKPTAQLGKTLAVLTTLGITIELTEPGDNK